MSRWVNPTGLGVRVDLAGDGHFGARRGKRKHKGLDLLCTPGQAVVAPIDAVITRIALPYADSHKLRGVMLAAAPYSIKMFYLLPFNDLIGGWIERGKPIGTAQDVSERYAPSHMQAHVHVEVRLGTQLVDPYTFFFAEVPT